MLNFAKNRDLPMVLKLEQEAVNKYGLPPSKYRYNNLVLCYAKMNKPNEAESVIREMRAKGLKPDVVTYTTLIDAYKRAKNIDKCWEVFEDCRVYSDMGGGGDELLLSYMTRLCGATHDAEKALQLFAEMESDGFIETAKHYNAIISALGSSSRYADKAIEFWHKMQLNHVVPDNHTFVAVFRACAKLGDVETAFDALQDMKIHDLKMTEHTYNGLIRVYAGAAQ